MEFRRRLTLLLHTLTPALICVLPNPNLWPSPCWCSGKRPQSSCKVLLRPIFQTKPRVVASVYRTPQLFVFRVLSLCGSVQCGLAVQVYIQAPAHTIHSQQQSYQIGAQPLSTENTCSMQVLLFLFVFWRWAPHKEWVYLIGEFGGSIKWVSVFLIKGIWGFISVCSLSTTTMCTDLKPPN